MDDDECVAGPSQPKYQKCMPNPEVQEVTSVKMTLDPRTGIAQSTSKKYIRSYHLLAIARNYCADRFKAHYFDVTGKVWKKVEGMKFVLGKAPKWEQDMAKDKDVEELDITLLNKGYQALEKMNSQTKKCPKATALAEQIKTFKLFRNSLAHLVLDHLDESKLDEHYLKLKNELLVLGYLKEDLDKVVARLGSKRVPYHRYDLPNECFSGRAELLQDMQNFIKQCNRAESVYARTIVITGLMGMGKSEIAKQLAKTLRSQFDLIYWFNAETKEGLDTCFRNLSDVALGEKLKSEDKVTPSVISKLYQQICEKYYDALFIFDNAEALESESECKFFGIKDYLQPDEPKTVAFIVTSRNLRDDWRKAAIKCIELVALSDDESYQCLLKHLRLENMDIPVDLKGQIESLAKLLEGHALGLDIIGSEIYEEADQILDDSRRYASAIQEYTELLRRSAFRNLPGQEKYEEKFGEIFNHVITKIRNRDRPQRVGEFAEKILNIIGLLSPDEIYLGLLNDILYPQKPPRQFYEYRSFAWDEIDRSSDDDNMLKVGLNVLTRTSLLKREAHERFEMIKVHRMVQQCIRKKLAKDGSIEPFESVLSFLAVSGKVNACLSNISLFTFGKTSTFEIDYLIVEKSKLSGHIASALSFYFSGSNSSVKLSIVQVLELSVACKGIAQLFGDQLQGFLLQNEVKKDESTWSLFQLVRIYIRRGYTDCAWNELKSILDVLSPESKKNYLVVAMLIEIAVDAGYYGQTDAKQLVFNWLMKACRNHECCELSLGECFLILYHSYSCNPGREWNEDELDKTLAAHNSSVDKVRWFWGKTALTMDMGFNATLFEFLFSTGLLQNCLLYYSNPARIRPNASETFRTLMLKVIPFFSGITTSPKARSNLEEPLWHVTVALLDLKSRIHIYQIDTIYFVLGTWCRLFFNKDIYDRRGRNLCKLVNDLLLKLDDNSGCTFTSDRLADPALRTVFVTCLEHCKAFTHCSFETRKWIDEVLKKVKLHYSQLAPSVHPDADFRLSKWRREGQLLRERAKRNCARRFRGHFELVTGLSWDSQADDYKQKFVYSRVELDQSEMVMVTDAMESWDGALLLKAYEAVEQTSEEQLNQCVGDNEEQQIRRVKAADVLNIVQYTRKLEAIRAPGAVVDINKVDLNHAWYAPSVHNVMVWRIFLCQ